MVGSRVYGPVVPVGIRDPHPGRRYPAPARYPLYLSNREHLAARHIEALTRVRAELIDRTRLEVRAWDVEPIHAGLFGSFTRGTADSDSDIDVLVVRPTAWGELEEATWLGQLDGLERRIKAWTGNDAQIIDLTSVTLGEMAQESDPSVDSWVADDIPVYGERFLDLVQRLR